MCSSDITDKVNFLSKTTMYRLYMLYYYSEEDLEELTVEIGQRAPVPDQRFLGYNPFLDVRISYKYFCL